jgi:hypothetical protein
VTDAIVVIVAATIFRVDGIISRLSQNLLSAGSPRSDIIGESKKDLEAMRFFR